MRTIISLFSIIPHFHRFCNTNKCKFAISLFPRARVPGVLHFSLSQVSHFLSYYVVNDTIIAVLSFPLTIWDYLFLKKSFRGVWLLGWMWLGKSSKKGVRKQSSVTLVTAKKQHRCWKARAYSCMRVYACLCARVRVEMVAHLCALVRIEPSRMRGIAWG